MVGSVIDRDKRHRGEELWADHRGSIGHCYRRDPMRLVADNLCLHISGWNEGSGSRCAHHEA